MLGLRPGGRRECWRERGRLHGKTHNHMQEELCPGPVGKQVPRQHRDAQISSLPPGRESSPEHGLRLTYATGDKHASRGQRGCGARSGSGGGDD